MLNPPVIPSFHLVQCQRRVRLHRSSVPTRTRSVRLGVFELLGYDARCAVLASRRRPCERQWEWHDDICYENPLSCFFCLSVRLVPIWLHTELNLQIICSINSIVIHCIPFTDYDIIIPLYPDIINLCDNIHHSFIKQFLHSMSWSPSPTFINGSIL